MQQEVNDVTNKQLDVAEGRSRRRRRNPSLLTVAGAASIAGLSQEALRWNVRKGYLPARWTGYRYLIRREDLERFIELHYE